MTLNHIHLGTKNLDACLDFYGLFGFQKKSEHGQGVFLTNKVGFLIAIDPVEIIPQFPSWFHLGFCLSSEGEVQNLYEQTKHKGFKIARELLYEAGEFASFFLWDPNGYKIEVSWHKE